MVTKYMPGDKVYILPTGKHSGKKMPDGAMNGVVVESSSDGYIVRVEYEASFGKTSGWYHIDRIAIDEEDWIARHRQL